jgi:hypothetical protein
MEVFFRRMHTTSTDIESYIGVWIGVAVQWMHARYRSTVPPGYMITTCEEFRGYRQKVPSNTLYKLDIR